MLVIYAFLEYERLRIKARGSECESKWITALLLIGLNIHCYRHFNDTTANVRLCASSVNGLTVTFPPLFFEAVLS